MAKEVIKSTKTCLSCNKSKPKSSFYKISTDFSEDGRMAICSDCTSQKYNVDNHREVLTLLRQLNRPFLRKVWDEQKEKWQDKFTFGRYLAQITSSKKYSLYDYSSSDHIKDNGEEIYSLDEIEKIITSEGKEIVVDEQLIFDWGSGFTTIEYLKMEKFFQDSLNNFSVITPIDRDQLRTLIKTSIRRDRALANNDVNEFEKLSKQYDTIMKSQSLRPMDRQGKDQEAGLKSFAQVFKTVEQEGYTAPQSEVITKDVEDIFDRMIISILNYYNRIVGEELLERVPVEDKELYSEYFSEEEDSRTPEEKLEMEILKTDLDQQRQVLSIDTNKDKDLADGE